MRWRIDSRIIRIESGVSSGDSDTGVGPEYDEWRFDVTELEESAGLLFFGHCYLPREDGFVQAFGGAYCHPVDAFDGQIDFEELFEEQVKEPLYDLLRRSASATGSLVDLTVDLPRTAPGSLSLTLEDEQKAAAK